ncbi:hypothetical protein Ciccas_011341 [Cichlidogyrus casuarinus]|uniref:Uncharacterized protein n=1 Tax=Cichlidogyrus casuarinus TaxID=1844966 RepID=A0ABD2PSR6_9PLAT
MLLLHITYNSAGTTQGEGKLFVSSAMRAIGLRFSEYETKVSFYFDFHGCIPTEVDADAYHPCDESLMFYCDQSKSSLGKPYLVPHCFRLMVNSQGVTQIDDMGPQVASLKAYDTTKNLVLATGTQPSMQLFSRDNGLIWAVTGRLSAK